MSAKWLRIESIFVHHYKVQRLADHLKISKAEAGWSIMHALSWFSQMRPTGQVAGQHRDSDATALEKFCEWGGARGELLAGFIAAELIDNVPEDGGFAYHDWPEYQGKVTATAEKERKRKADYRARKAAEKAAREAGLSHGTEHGTNAGRPALRDVTGRDGTERNDLSTPPPSLESNDRREGSKAQELKDLRVATEGAPEIAQAFAAVWLLWACDNGATEKPGQLAHARTVYWFQKYAGDSPEDARRLTEHLKLAWLDFIEHCTANGRTPGWGLWLEEKVGQFRLDEAREGLLPRNREPFRQTPMPLGVLGRVRT